VNLNTILSGVAKFLSLGYLGRHFKSLRTPALFYDPLMTILLLQCLVFFNPLTL